MTAVTERIDFGPWNPGIQSQLPAAVLPLATAFSSKNVFTTIAEAHERSAFTGLDPEDLVAFRPERLVVHELLIRVMGDVSVPDGPEYADLGVNFRKIAETIHRSHIDPHMADIVRRLPRAAATRGRAHRERAVIEPLRSGDGFERASRPGAACWGCWASAASGRGRHLQASRTRNAASLPNGSNGLPRATSRS